MISRVPSGADNTADATLLQHGKDCFIGMDLWLAVNGISATRQGKQLISI